MHPFRLFGVSGGLIRRLSRESATLGRMARIPEYVTVVDLKSGRRYEVRVEVTGPDGHRRQSRRRFEILRDAVEHYSEVAADRSRGVHVAPNQLTVRQASDDWMAGQRLTVKAHSAYVTALRPWVDALGDRPVQTIKKADIERVVTTLIEGTSAMGTWNAPTKIKKLAKKTRDWGPRTINASLGKIESVFKDLQDQGVLVRNPASMVKRLKTTKRKPTTLTPGQADLLLSATAGQPLNIAWWIAIYGVRRGENGGLRWDSIDLDAGTLKVQEARLATPGGSSPGAVKTDASVRTLPLPPDLASALRGERRRQKELQLQLGNKWPNSGMVVVGAMGEPPHPDTITHEWTKALAKLKIPHVRLHDARHTCATLMHLNGVPEGLIAAWLGHTDARFTLATYARVGEDNKQALLGAAKTFSDVLHKREENAKSV